MEGNRNSPISPEQSSSCRRPSLLYRDNIGWASDSSDSDWVTTNSSEQNQQVPSHSTQPTRPRFGYYSAPPPRFTSSGEQSSASADSPYHSNGLPARGRGSRLSLNSRGRRRGSNSGFGPTGSPSRLEAGRRRGSAGNENHNPRSGSRSLLPGLGDNTREGIIDYESALFASTPYGNDEANASFSNVLTSLDIASLSATRPISPSFRNQGMDMAGVGFIDEDEFPELSDEQFSRLSSRLAARSSQSSIDDLSILSRLKAGTGAMKRPREKFEPGDEKDLIKTLVKKGAVSVMLYHTGIPHPGANDVWPNIRDAAKLPAQYFLLGQEKRTLPATATRAKRFSFRDSLRPTKILKLKVRSPDPEPPPETDVPQAQIVWPAGEFPTELFEEVAGYLNRDDIKAMRLVCREFNRHVSQVLFKTVVVPFNTEIYGMLGKEQKQDIKGKRKMKVVPNSHLFWKNSTNNGLFWKNANGDDVYNGHGLDVFRGFGQHILRYGMSFEVNEDALAKPPEKTLTERHTSFWGSYEWPYDEYRRFEDVAGLESAADETPRMKIAFSELAKVRELALSINSGLGWLHGPDRSIRARIFQRLPEVFGTLGKIPDRRAQAQKDLWDYIESCHRAAESDVKLATLYRVESNQRALLEYSNHVLQEQPEMPFLDPHIINEAIPHDSADIQIPTSFEDPDVLERFVSAPQSPGTGLLFTSSVFPTDAGQLRNAIIPANLTKAQKEWLLETEWAQRAFLSSYMLSIIDNPITFKEVHTLNISQLSDRYVAMMSRKDFWNALPGLKNVRIQVIPGWRNVVKDEAGFVETPKISPSNGIDPFYELLKFMISGRANIRKLTFGWATGGEHAEGVHARNRNILPAPLLPADSTLEQNPGDFREQLLQFPHVEELTLKNCWITPPVLQELVRQHDKLSLKTLVLDSVSLTAMLRQQANAQPQHHAQQVAGQVAGMLAAHMLPAAVNAGGPMLGFPPVGGNPPANQQINQNPVTPHQLLQAQIQALQLQIQQLQTQNNLHAQGQAAVLQAQLQSQIQLQNQQNQPVAAHWWLQAQMPAPQPAAAPAPAPAPVAPQPTQNGQTILQSQPRVGSWMYILDIISPGLNLSDFNSEHSLADPERRTSLRSIHFISCGYVKLPYVQVDQTAIEPANPLIRNPLFTKKYNALAPAMLSAKWPLLGEIVQEVDTAELAGLNAGWYLETGWKDVEEARAVEFDGLLPGGTGRLSGWVRKADRMG
ncbi:hypothetical protein K469DRAFT_744593 [Zopfia rhizophila CBS 207.26]|uniref:F-box domain-containing protein n=1 Tax=Zopfia rhizophila CBS 207.26 TaxID=1314779 RepID=A0A6A6EUB8_9PEZI|nr:hypothetical protein K469DRAFT_744593 [Zopfia rhizophila CBS 207.26]